MTKRNQYAFDKKAYDHLHIQVARGKKSTIQKHVDELGISINSYVNDLIRKDLQLSETEWKRRENTGTIKEE